MSTVKYVSVHERDDGKRMIKPGKGKREHDRIRLPTPDNDLEEFQRSDWERVDFWRLPEAMPKSDFVDWWNDHLRADDEPDVIDKVLQAMGER